MPPHRGERRAAQAGSVPEEGARRRTGRRGTRCSGSRRGAGQSLGFPPSLNGAGPVVFGTQPVVSSPDVFCVGFASSRFALGWVGRFLCAAAQMKPVHWVVGFLSLVGWLVRDECMGIGEAAPRVCLAGSPHRRAPVHGRAGVAEGGRRRLTPVPAGPIPTPLAAHGPAPVLCPPAPPPSPAPSSHTDRRHPFPSPRPTGPCRGPLPPRAKAKSGGTQRRGGCEAGGMRGGAKHHKKPGTPRTANTGRGPRKFLKILKKIKITGRGHREKRRPGTAPKAQFCVLHGAAPSAKTSPSKKARRVVVMRVGTEGGTP